MSNNLGKMFLKVVINVALRQFPKRTHIKAGMLSLDKLAN
jgi:hypothetical protein